MPWWEILEWLEDLSQPSLAKTDDIDTVVNILFLAILKILNRKSIVTCIRVQVGLLSLTVEIVKRNSWQYICIEYKIKILTSCRFSHLWSAFRMKRFQSPIFPMFRNEYFNIYPGDCSKRNLQEQFRLSTSIISSFSNKFVLRLVCGNTRGTCFWRN